ncbi:MAG: hypothetical protein Q8P59_01755 [Dehalococcoidia bacterium]|nr:hypothetical protein [Dehalococcoidia bacterium]
MTAIAISLGDVVCHLLIGGEPGLTVALPEIQGGPDLRRNSSATFTCSYPIFI